MHPLVKARRLLVSLSLSGGISIATLPAAAQQPPPPPSAATAAEGKRHFDVGLKLYADGAFAEALVEFQASYRLGARPSALKNVAQCHRDLKQYAEAYEAQELMLAAHAAQLKDPEKAAVGRALQELGELTGAVKVAASEGGADVEVDGRPIGATPLPRAKRVKLGAHKIRVTKSGFDPFEREITIASNQSVDVDAKLEPEVSTGHLSVREQQGDEVHVVVDGVDKGPAPWEGDLPPGEHTVETTGLKFAAEKRTITLAKKQRLDVVVDATTTLARVRVSALPASAAIRVDGVLVGTGVWEAEVAVGAHRVEVSLPGYPNAVRDISLLRGQSMMQEIQLLAPAAGVALGPEYRGVYGNLSLFTAFALHNVAHVTAPVGGGTVDPGKDFGFGTALRIGYHFDVFALELVGAAMVTLRTDHRAITATGDEDFKFNSFGFFVGAGGRITSRDPTVRFTIGLAPGVAVRHFEVDRDSHGNTSPKPCTGPSDPSCGSTTSTSSNSNFHEGAGYAAPGFLLQGGMLLGNTPGAKLYLGMHAWVDFPPRDIAVGPDTTAPATGDGAFSSPVRGYVAASGPQFYFGPVLGIQFGH